MANEITIELTDKQYKLYQIMEEHNLEIGDAIELIFNLRDQLELRNDELIEERIAELTTKKETLQNIIEKTEGNEETLNEEIEKIDKELGVIDKLMNTALDYDEKYDILEKEYATIDDSYEMKVQVQKSGIKWNEIFSKLF